jgi:hypothetical protein
MALAIILHEPTPSVDSRGHRIVLAQADGFSGRNPTHDVPPSHHR